MPDSEHADPGPTAQSQASPARAILLLEDEPVSAEFLRLALAPLGFDVCHASSVREASDLLRQRHFSLLLLDLSLPDGSGSVLLSELRASQANPSRGAMAIALTAELDEARRAALLALGFEDALAKPIAAAALRDAVSLCLATAASSWPVDKADPAGAAATWDVDAALAACGGSREVLDALRGLFLKELPEQLGRIRRALDAGESQAALDEVHRLLAGCGFCGAVDLSRSAKLLMQAVRASRDPTLAMSAFETSASRLLETHPSEHAPEG